MTDLKLITKAVELSDGFGFNNKTVGGQLVYRYPTGTIVVHSPSGFPVWFFDALAAQLVRQVDALDTPDTVEITHDSVWVGYRSKNNESWKRTRRTKSRDRTMNTIKAIVDSDVLPEPVLEGRATNE